MNKTWAMILMLAVTVTGCATSGINKGDFNMISSIGAFVFGFSQLLFVWAIWSSVKGTEKATDQVWEGAEGLEWTLPSPAPYHSFETPPEVK